MIQFSHPYMTTGKTKALTRQTFVGKVMSLLFNMLSRLVITFLPRSKSFNFMAAATICSDSGAQEKSVTASQRIGVLVEGQEEYSVKHKFLSFLA